MDWHRVITRPVVRVSTTGRAEIIPFTGRQPATTAPPHTIHLEPLGPADKLTQATRWLGNIEHNLARKSATREENLRAALRDVTPVAERLEEAAAGSLSVHRDPLSIGRVGECRAHIYWLSRLGLEALTLANRGWTREAEEKLADALQAARCAVAVLDLVLAGGRVR